MPTGDDESQMAENFYLFSFNAIYQIYREDNHTVHIRYYLKKL